MRDELTSRLHQARQLLSSLPDLSDRPQAPVSAPRPLRRPHRPRRRSSPPAETTAPSSAQHAAAAAQEAPVRRPSPTPHAGRGESEAARQPVTTAPQRAPETRQLPMPPRPGATGSTAASQANPPTQAIDQPAQVTGLTPAESEHPLFLGQPTR